MSEDRRAFVVVLDACGCGELPDSGDYGDAGTNTLAHLAEAVGALELPELERLGLGNVLTLAGVRPVDRPAVHGRLHPIGAGKDSTAGHWGLMGVAAGRPPIYPGGFPAEVIAEFERVTGRHVIGNAAREGLGAIEEFGQEQLESGGLIVYTSQDSVFQVAAHVSVVPEEELYEHCAAARRILTGEHAVGRVIARPFEGDPGHFTRTSGRRDFALHPPRPTYLDEIRAAGLPVHAVGKVGELFAGQGIDEEHHAPDNPSAIAAIDALAGELDRGLVFANLVDTDQVYGHRGDAQGFHRSLQETDAAVARWRAAMRAGDMLVLTADHGCDITHPGSDHTREHVPLLSTFEGCDGRRVDGAFACVGASALRWLTGRTSRELPGEPFT